MRARPHIDAPVPHRAVLSVLALVTAGCSPSPNRACEPCLSLAAVEGDVLARVGPATLTVESVAKEARSQGKNRVKQLKDPQRLKQFVEDQVRFELLAHAALERGLDRDPEVIEGARKIMVRQLLERDMQEEVFRPVTPAQIAAYYAKHQHEYIKPEMRRYAAIQLAPSEEGRAIALSLLETLAKKPDDQTLFASLRRKHSLDRTHRRLGMQELHVNRNDLEQEFGPHFTRTVFEAAPNELLSQPVQSTKGWHVVRVLSVRPSLTRELSDVEPEIRELLQRGVRSEAFDTYLAGLKRRFPVAIYDQQVESLGRELNPKEQP